MSYQLDFFNKNINRNFPIKASCNRYSITEQLLPNSIICTVSISTSVDRSNIYIRQVVVKKGVVAVTIEHYDGSTPANTTTLGVFRGTVTSHFQSFKLEPFVDFVGGYMTFGDLNLIKESNFVYNFDYVSTTLEPSTIFCFVPPAVRSLNHRGTKLQGDITFGSLVNLTLDVTGTDFDFNAINRIGLESLADQSSEFRNCPTPVITSINDTVPYSPDLSDENDFNIYIMGGDPIIFRTEEENSSIDVITPSVTLDTLCTQRFKVLPPISPQYFVNRTGFEGEEHYYTKSQFPIQNLKTTKQPEHKSWLYFMDTLTTFIEDLEVGTEFIHENGSEAPIIKANYVGTISKIRVIPNTSNVTFQVYKDGYPIFAANQTITTVGDVLIPTQNTSFTPTDSITIEFININSATSATVMMFYTSVPSLT